MSNFEFGFAKEDITPVVGMPLCGYFNLRPNKGFFDPLSVKAAVFRTGDSCAAVVSFDLCLLPGNFCREIDDKLKAENSPLAGKVMYTATHTHTGPFSGKIFGADADQEYIDELQNKAVFALKKACRSLCPAELYTAETECTTLAFNRRFIMKDGKTLTNPGKLNPDIDHPEGGVDHKIIMMQIRQFDRPVMLLTNISNHTDTIGGDVVSGDWPCRMEMEIQYALGYAIPVMTIIAPQGNINHFDITTSGSQTGYEEAVRIGKGYAAAILSALYRLKKQEDCTVDVRNIEFEAPYYQLSDEEYAESKKIYEENKDAVMEEGRDFTSEDIARGVPCVKKMFAEMAIGCRENPITEKRIEQQRAITLGTELAFISLPAEPFVEIGAAIRKLSRFRHTVVAALGMGEVGYVGLPGNYGNGGYETSPSRDLAGRNVGETFIANAAKLIG